MYWGGGIAGFATANSLAKHYPDAKISLLEALKFGQGTSSRNAGFIIDLPHNLDGLEANVEQDRKIYELNCFAINYLKEIVEEKQIPCQWQKAGKYMCAHEESNLKGLDNFERHLKPCARARVWKKEKAKNSFRFYRMRYFSFMP